jgi:hypothetical protein
MLSPGELCDVPQLTCRRYFKPSPPYSPSASTVDMALICPQAAKLGSEKEAGEVSVKTSGHSHVGGLSATWFSTASSPCSRKRASVDREIFLLVDATSVVYPLLVHSDETWRNLAIERPT